MKVGLRLQAILRRYRPAGFTGDVVQLDLDEGATVRDAVEALSVPVHLVHAVFRVFMVNDNQPMNTRELGERIGKDPELILRTISGKTVYQGLRPVMEGAG